MTKNHKGIFFLSFSGLVAALLLAGCPDPNKNGDSPAVASPTKQGIAFSGNTLEITFDKELKAFDASGITVTLDDSVIAATAYTLSVSGKKLVMTFTAPPRANQKYKVSLKAGAVTGKDGGTTKKEDSAETTFGAPPVFQSMAFSSEKKLELTFDKTLDEPIDAPSAFHPDPSKVTITRAGMALTNKTDYTLGIDGTRLVITFKTSPTANQKYTVALGEGAVKSDTRLSPALGSQRITFGVTPPPTYTGIARNNNKIELSFSKNLVTEANVSPNPTHITVTRAGKALTNKTDYSLSIDGKKLVITLKFKTPPNIAGDYTVALRAKAVKSVDGKFSAAVKSNPAITMYNLPAIVGAPVFKTGSATELLVTFNTALSSIDTGSFTVESKAAAKDSTYKSVSTSSIEEAKDKKQVELTLKTAATDGMVYRLVVAIGGVTATAGGVSNVDKLESAGVAYSAKPALSTSPPPYIVGKKLVATFNMNIALVKAANVKVYKGSGDPGTPVTGTTARVLATKTRLEVTLPNPVVAKEIYRLKLLADAVSKEGDTNNKNAEFTSSNITILAAPVLDKTQDPYMVGRKIYVTFDKAIKAGAVDSDKVKVKKKGTTGNFGAATKPTTNSVVNSTNNKQLVITVDDDPPKDNHYYRVHLEAGAITNRNTALTVAIIPTDKDIQVTDGPVLTGITPVFSSKTELSVTLPEDMKLILPANKLNDIKLDKKADEGNFEEVNTVNRSIAIDSTDPNKVNITLKNGTEATLYTQTWKVIFPKYSVLKLTESRSANNAEQATDEIKPRLSDIYSWKKVLASGAPANGNRWTARYDHTSVVFPASGENSKIWVMGGKDSTNRLNDVWSSVDGSTWTNESNKLLDTHVGGSWTKYADLTAAVAGNALWPARTNHTSVVFKDKIWVMGGYDDTDFRNDVWSSTDGITWVKSPAPTNPTTKFWSVRDGHASVVFQNKIWVMGGYDGMEERNDVWSSADGSTWNKIAPSESAKHWAGRNGHEAVVANGKIWVTTGAFLGDYWKDVWYSTDGADWTQARDIPVVTTYASSALFKSRIWLLGGGGGLSPRNNHVFSLAEDADDSTAWVTEKNADWPARYGHTSVVFKDKIWVLGGHRGYKIYVNDVWSFGVQN